MTLTLCRRPGTRQVHLHLLALIMLALTLSNPTPAQALTWNKDGVTSIGAADCVIVADFRNPTSVNLGSAFKREGNELFAIYKAPDGGGTWSVDGSILLTYNKGLLDNRGVYHTLYIRISGVNGIWKRGLTTSRGKKNVRQLIGTLARDWIALESSAAKITYNGTSLHDNSSSTGLNCGIYAWTDASGANLAYNLLVKDIDQPNYIVTPSSFSGAWQERVGLRSAELKGAAVHVQSNTYLTYSASVISGTRDADSSATGSIYTAAFAARLTLTGTEVSGNPAKGFAIGWSGSRCQSRIFEDLAYSIVTKAGPGGACHQVAGTNDTATPIALAQKTVADGAFVTRTDLETVPKNNYIVTVTPKAGYEINEVTLDGKPVTVSNRTSMSVPIRNIVANHVVTATFMALPDEPEPDPEPELGSLVLQKVSARPDITSANSCYTLEGAQYDVYADEACTDSIASLVTDAEGLSQSVHLGAATYYVRESVASPGYRLDESVHEIDVHEGQESKLEVLEDPVMSGLELDVRKLDADLGTQAPQGSASLGEAIFSVLYYNGIYASLDELPEAATRSWTLSTDMSGRASFDEEHLVAGDDPYLDGEGKACLPLGTILVREEQPSNGYGLPDTPLLLFANVVQADGVIKVEPLVGSPSLEIEVHEPVLRGGLRLKKVDNQQNPLEGAVFAVVNTSDHPVVIDGAPIQPGEECLTVTSDSDGIAATSDSCLPFGTYEVREQKAPRGFRTDTSWKAQVDITEAGKVVDLTEEPLINEPITLDVTLKAHKNFDGSSQDRDLLPEMFTFTLSDNEGKVIGTATNDADGTVSFEPLSFGYDNLGADLRYTIAEVTGTDEEIVYDTHIEEVHIRIAAKDDGELSAEVVTDDDGIVFENRTVEKLTLPMTGRKGTGAEGAASLGAIALGLWEARRRRGAR